MKNEKYKTVDSNKSMGLNNKPCLSKDYFCGLKRVWLSNNDVENKHCKCKPTFDMISTYRCPYLKENE